MLERLVDAGWRAGLFFAYRSLRLYWFVVRPRTTSVHVAVWCRGRVLLVQNSYRSGYSLPAGSPKRGEPPVVAALRELREEVGIALAEGELRFAERRISREDYKEDHGDFFEIELEREPAVAIDRREIEWAAFVPLDETADLPLSQRLAGFLHARHR